MKQIYLVEQAMVFNDDEKKPFKHLKWDVLYATSTEEEAKEDVKINRRKQVELKKELNLSYKCYFRVEEINLL